MTVVGFIAIAVVMMLNCIAFGATYWAAGMYFGWTLVLSATAIFLLIQGLVLINLYRGERDDY